MKILIICALVVISTSAIASTLQEIAKQDLAKLQATQQHMIDPGYLKAGDNAVDGKTPIQDGTTVHRHNPHWNSHVLHDGKLIVQHEGAHDGTGE